MLTSFPTRAALACVFISTLFDLRASAQGTFVEPLDPSELQFTVGGVAPSGGIRLWTLENFGHGPKPTQAEIAEAVRVSKAAAANAPPQVFPPSPAAFDLQFTVTAPPPGAAAAITAVETYYEALLATTHASGPILISVNFAPLGPTIIMNTASTLYTISYAPYLGALSANADPDDFLFTFLPTTTMPVQFTHGGATTNCTDFLITAATLVGTYPTVVPGVVGPHSTITVSSTFSFDYDPTNGIGVGLLCFRTVFAHEIGHALGFNSAISLPSPTVPTQMDFLRFQRTANTATGFTDWKNRSRLVHINTPNDDHECSFVHAHYSMEDGNPDQASHFREETPAIGLMDPGIASGVTFHPNYLQTSDLRVLDFLGFDWNDPELQPRTEYRFDAEPNSVKSEATPALTMTPGHTIIGTTTGTGVTPGDTTLTSTDVHRVKTGALPLGIYRHNLTLTSSTAGHNATIRGLAQSGGVISTTDVQIQASAAVSGNRLSAWYGFGKQEELYYAVTGSGSTTAVYAATLSTSTINATNIAGSFSAGPITVSATGGFPANDTELYVYDSNLNPVPLGHNDDPIGTGPATITVNLSPGTYYVASSTYNTANNQSDAHPNEQYTGENVLDHPNAVINSDSGTAGSIGFMVTDGAFTGGVSASHSNPFEVAWGRFTVGIGAPVSVCKGDGTGAPCPCGNTSTLLGAGCRNPFFGGAGSTLSVTGSASIAADTLILTASNIPGPCLFIQENLGTQLNFGDGHLCSNTSIVRLGVVFAAGGIATYPGGVTPAPVHIAGGASNGQTKVYQCWYRSNPAMCSAVALYNLTQGMRLTWGP